MEHTEKLAWFNETIQDYQDALADLRRAQNAVGDREGSVQFLEEVREEAVAARARFDAADRALHS